jgi:hypothetical protein
MFETDWIYLNFRSVHTLEISFREMWIPELSARGWRMYLSTRRHEADETIPNTMIISAGHDLRTDFSQPDMPADASDPAIMKRKQFLRINLERLERSSQLEYINLFDIIVWIYFWISQHFDQ